MVSRFFGTGASLLFLVSTLFSKGLLNSPVEEISKPAELSESDAPVAGSSGNLGFLASSMDRLTIKVTDFKSEVAPSVSEFNDFVVELIPKSKAADVASASFSRRASLKTLVDPNESLFGYFPVETVKPTELEFDEPNKLESVKTAKNGSKAKRKSNGPARDTIGLEAEESATDGSDVISRSLADLAPANRRSSILESIQRSSGLGGGGGGIAGGSGFSGAGIRNGGGSGAFGGGGGFGGGGFGGGGGPGGLMPSIGGGGSSGTSQNAVISSVDQVLASRNASVATGATSFASGNGNAFTGNAPGVSTSQSSSIVSSGRPQLTADGKFGIPNHQYWKFDFTKNGDGNDTPGEESDAVIEFDVYLSRLTADLQAKNQVVKFSPDELRNIYLDLNRQAKLDPIKSVSFVTFMIIDFPVKGFYTTEFPANIPDNLGSNANPFDPGVP